MHREIFVTKRDGSTKPYDISKIKKSIEFATADQGVNPLQLESSIDHFIKNGIKTSYIQDNIIRHALQLATAQEPQWIIVAGRALAMQQWADFKLRNKSFYEIIQYNIKKGEYTADLNKFYTKEQMNELGSYIDMTRDLAHSHASLITATKKYLGKYELNQHMHMVNAMRFGQLEKPESRIEFVKAVYDVLSLRLVSLATPFMSNLRKGGNVSSCFILSIADDLDSIFQNIHRMAKISKNGGGLGVYLGHIRAKGSSVNGADNAAGSITQWVKIINDTMVAVNQGGKRAGAASVALPVWHNDISDFLDMQTEHGDIRLKSFDVFPQIVVHDIFMERDANKQPWTTFCPFEVKTKLGIDVNKLWGKEFTEAYLKIEEAAQSGKLKVTTRYENARDITKQFMRTWVETGLPYTTFIDTINETNPNKHDGLIQCVNLCTESFSNTVADQYAHTCNLCSINLSNVESFQHLGEISRLAARILDYGIELSNNPDSITMDHNNRYRTIGIGQMGLHDYLAKNFTTYNDLATISKISECIEYNAALESTQLAKEYGAYEAFNGSMWQTGELVSKFKSKSCGEYDWDYLQSQIDTYGIRNSQLTSPAPTTSTALYQDCSASILPVFDAFFGDDNSNGALLVAAKYLSQNPVGYGKTLIKFKSTEIIDITAAEQEFIDTGCSMELLFDHNDPTFTAKTLYDAFRYAHHKKTKAIYYIRNSKKNSKGPACVGCSG